MAPFHPRMALPETARSVDPAEVARFGALAEEWWNPNGKFAPLHRFNPARLGFLREEICRHFGRDPRARQPLAGLALLDIGCGGGLIAEPMARLGARVLGADAAEANVRVAALHAAAQGLAITYRTATAEALAAEGLRFDVVLALEIVEHVADLRAFLAACADLLAPGGLIAVATLNRTLRAFALAIVGAEYVLGWLPRGTHDWRRFLRPEELEREMRAVDLIPRSRVGFRYAPLSDRWEMSADLGVNYALTATRPAAPLAGA